MYNIVYFNDTFEISFYLHCMKIPSEPDRSQQQNYAATLPVQAEHLNILLPLIPFCCGKVCLPGGCEKETLRRGFISSTFYQQFQEQYIIITLSLSLSVSLLFHLKLLYFRMQNCIFTFLQWPFLIGWQTTIGDIKF